MKKVLITGASGFVGQTLAQKYLDAGWQVNGIGTSLNHPMAEAYDNFYGPVRIPLCPGGGRILWPNRMSSSTWRAEIFLNAGQRRIKKPFMTPEFKPRNIWWMPCPAPFMGSCSMPLRQDFTVTGVIHLCLRLNRTAPVFWPGCVGTGKPRPDAPASKGARVAIMRFGVVLGSGGALTVMSQAFRMFVGGPLGSGEQWFPWIHLNDLARAVFFLMEHNAQGIYNFTGPVPIRQKAFAKELGRALNRPAIMPAPAFFIRLFMGQLGDSLLCSQKALPAALETAGFRFKYDTAAGALTQIFKTRNRK